MRADEGSAVVDRLFRVAFGCGSCWGRRRSPASSLFNSASRPRLKGFLSMLNTVLRVVTQECASIRLFLTISLWGAEDTVQGSSSFNK